MPYYDYRCVCGRDESRLLPMSQASFRPLCACGKLMERDIVAEQRGRPHRPGLWPMKSISLGVQPDQVQEAEAEAKKCGVPTKFTPDGLAILTSPRHRREYAKMNGMHGKNEWC